MKKLLLLTLIGMLGYGSLGSAEPIIKANESEPQLLSEYYACFPYTSFIIDLCNFSSQDVIFNFGWMVHGEVIKPNTSIRVEVPLDRYNVSAFAASWDELHYSINGEEGYIGPKKVEYFQATLDCTGSKKYNQYEIIAEDPY